LQTHADVDGSVATTTADPPMKCGRGVAKSRAKVAATHALFARRLNGVRYGVHSDAQDVHGSAKMFLDARLAEQDVR